VRIIQLNQAGKVVKKKKTACQEGTKKPVFNETLNFDVSPMQVPAWLGGKHERDLSPV